MRILMFAPVLRAGSYNKKLIRVAAKAVQEHSFCEVDLCEFNDFQIPVYDGDLEKSNFPKGVQELGKKCSEADAIIISCPEYNGSMPGPFKNAVDWLSRLDPVPLKKKHIFFLGATPGNLATVRGNIHLRVPFHILGSFVYPEFFGLPKADEAFDADGNLKDNKQKEKMAGLLKDFLHFASRKETPFDELENFVKEKSKSADKDSRPHA